MNNVTTAPFVFHSPSASELVIILSPCNLDFAEFVGSRAMLEAEDIIPAGTQWPEGYDDLRWQAGQFDYWLRRQRPEGAKGPRKAFADCDWWCLRRELVNAPSASARMIQLKAKALKDEIYRQSAEGRAESRKHFERYWETTKDAKFQAFKSLIPGINRPKRGRPAKNTQQSQGAAA